MTEPTDAELDTVLCNQWPAFSMQATLVRVWVRAAMRDALAKWGTPPAVAGEPIGHLYCGGSYGDELADWEIVADQHQCDKLNEHHGSLGKEAKLPIYATQQPTQAQAGAVPLTDDEITTAAEDNDNDSAFMAGFATGARFAERHHGIKGADHA